MKLLLLFISSDDKKGIELGPFQKLSRKCSVFKCIDDGEKLIDYALQEKLLAKCTYMPKDSDFRAFAITKNGEDEVNKLFESFK